MLGNRIYEVPSYEKVTVPKENILMDSFNIQDSQQQTTGRCDPNPQ